MSDEKTEAVASEFVAPAKPSLRRQCARALLVCGVIYVLAGLGCASFQRRLIYFPPVLASEEVEQLGTAEGLERWRSPSGKPIGWKRLSTTRAAQGQVLLAHGNACGAFQCSHFADVMQQAAALDVFFLEYPGYADQPGGPSEATLNESAREAIQLLPTNHPTYVVGESLGTGVAACLAGRFPERVAGVVLLAPYNCLADVGQAHIRILPVSWILRDRFPASDHLRNYHGPLAVLVGGQDTVVPQKFGRRLYDDFSGPKRLWEFTRANHESLMFQPAAVWKEVFAFLQSGLGS